ncbi:MULTISPECIES: class I SAM-dependent methyltransferase [Streptosporangium]|uniref:O-methyltransferase YrrM n=1 Tax=Streptosporangium brasiliense TaxID=47480 RepID=A0ABT9QWV2_9ACTN|nr:class I SAM-dependent methyltransferase [Streptosporangium brasiliense]MDP9861447.1 putative O-methyltransferase YrrM [Streptosporangium brasiliense]
MTSTSHSGPPPASPGREQLRHLVRQLPAGRVSGPLLRALAALPLADRPFAWLERHPAVHGTVLSAFGLRRPIFIDHPARPEPRFGYGRPDHPQIAALLERGRARYAERLTRFLALEQRLAAIPVREHPGGTTPYWDNGWLPPLDALALYGFLTEAAPRRYVEIGSGNSTKFVRRAIDDHGLRTHVTSIDPAPRATVDALCDTVVRSPLERVDPGLFADLEAGDIVFLDGSHRVFMGSDVTVFFFEILPLLRPGVLVQLHDILLPSDYPPEWRWRHYSEQYLLAAFLLADPARFDTELPNAFIDGDARLRGLVEPLWHRLGLTESYRPASFWLRIRDRAPGTAEAAETAGTAGTAGTAA